MKQKQPRARVELAPVPRTVTLLGATGSIGSSTVDLLRQDPARYRVVAVTAYRNAAALARLARELGASFAAVADPDAYAELKAELSGSGIETAAGAAAVVEAAQRPADWVMAAITGATSLGPTLAAAEAARRWRWPIRNVSSAPAPCSCGGRLPPAPRSCRSIPSTTRFSRRWAPAAARMCAVSS
jgi:nucleoside-diphosphate-sugar epimerase